MILFRYDTAYRATNLSRVHSNGSSLMDIPIHYSYDSEGRLISESNGDTGETLREYFWLGLTPIATYAFTGGSANDNCDTVAIAALEDKISNKTARIATKQGRIANLLTKISNKQTRIVTKQDKIVVHQAKIAQLEATLAGVNPTNTTRIANLEAKIANRQARIVTLTATIAQLEGRIVDHQAKIVVIDAKIMVLQDQLIIHEADLAVLNADCAATPDVYSLYYLHADHLGKTQFATDTTGTIFWDGGTATPFGEGVSLASAFAQNLMFPGQYADDETGLSHNHHRTYDPTLGRYLQSDPIGLAGGLNRYAYVGGNPVSGIDPLGLDYWGILGKRFENYDIFEQVAFIHFNRNVFNWAPCYLSDAQEQGFSPEKKDFFHTWGIGASGNTKWQKGKNEGIYGSDGIRTDDALGGGTYNYGNEFFSHVAYDVAPYYWLGNTPNDPTNMIQRLLRTVNLPVYNGPVPPSPSCACKQTTTLRGSYTF